MSESLAVRPIPNLPIETLNPGDIFYWSKDQGKDHFLILAGAVTLRRTVRFDGKLDIVEIVAAPALISEVARRDGEVYPEEAETLTSVMLQRIKPDNLGRLERNPIAAVTLDLAKLGRVPQLQDHLERRALPVHRNLIFVLDLLTQLREESPPMRELSQLHLAEMVGCSRESVCKTLRNNPLLKQQWKDLNPSPESR